MSPPTRAPAIGLDLTYANEVRSDLLGLAEQLVAELVVIRDDSFTTPEWLHQTATDVQQTVPVASVSYAQARAAVALLQAREDLTAALERAAEVAS